MTEVNNELVSKILNKFKRRKGTHHHFSAVSKKDASGRYRYHIYIDGKKAKQNGTWTFWYFQPDSPLSLKEIKRIK